MRLLSELVGGEHRVKNVVRFRKLFLNFQKVLGDFFVIFKKVLREKKAPIFLTKIIESVQ